MEQFDPEKHVEKVCQLFATSGIISALIATMALTAFFEDPDDYEIDLKQFYQTLCALAMGFSFIALTLSTVVYVNCLRFRDASNACEFLNEDMLFGYNIFEFIAVLCTILLGMSVLACIVAAILFDTMVYGTKNLIGTVMVNATGLAMIGALLGLLEMKLRRIKFKQSGGKYSPEHDPVMGME